MIDYKALVARGYDTCGQAYTRAREKDQHPGLAVLTSQLPEGASILDIGCGAGIPITRSLADRFTVTGVDISAQQIQRARRNVPGATFYEGDIMSLDFPASQFDAAIAFYTVFHLPREEHRELFQRIYGWLRPGGYLLATVTVASENAPCS